MTSSALKLLALAMLLFINASTFAETEKVQKMAEAELKGELLDAVDNDDLKEIARLLEKGASPDVRIHDGRLLLHALLGHPGLAQEKEPVSSYLIEHGADIDVAFKSGITLLHEAARMGLEKSAKALIDNGINKTKKSNAGESALFYARSVSMLELLVENGVGEIDGLDAAGNSLLHKYFEGSDDDVLLSYLASKIDVNVQNEAGETALLLALDTWYSQTAEKSATALLALGANAKLRDKEGNSTLIRAAQNKFGVELIDTLLQAGVDIHQRDKFGLQAIHYAASSNSLSLSAQDDINLFKFLVSKGADIRSAATISKATPLHIAALNGQVDIVQFLLDKGADVNSKNSDGNTPLNHAINKQHEDVVELLERKGALATSKQQLMEIAEGNKQRDHQEAEDQATPYDRLQNAIRENNSKLIESSYKALIADGTVKIDDVEIAELMIRYSDDKTLQFAITNGLDIYAKDDEGFGLLHIAVFYGNLGAAKVLVDKGLDVHATSSDNDSVYQMTKNSSIEMLDLLLDAGLKLDKTLEPNMVKESLYSHNPVMAAHFETQGYLFPAELLQNPKYLFEVIRSQDKESLEYLIKKGLDIESRVSMHGESVTLLNAAVLVESDTMTSLILRAGGDPNARNSSGQPMYLDALMVGNAEIVKRLYSSGANVNDITGERIHKKVPLLEVLKSGNIEVARMLIDKGASLSEVDYMHKDTPLHLAAQLGDVSLLKLLVDKGADVHQLNEGRHAALDIAVKYAHPDAVKYLRGMEAVHPARKRI